MSFYSNLCLVPRLETLQKVIESRLKNDVKSFEDVYLNINVYNISKWSDSDFHKLNIKGYVPNFNSSTPYKNIPVIFQVHKNHISTIEDLMNCSFTELKDFDLLVSGKTHLYDEKIYFTANAFDLPKPISSNTIGVIGNYSSHGFNDFFKYFKATKLDVRFELRDVFIQDLSQVLEAIEYFKKRNIEKIVIIRGGGSSEQLNIFNDQSLLDILFELDKKIEVYVAVGHYGDRFKLGDRLSKTFDTPSELGRALKTELLSDRFVIRRLFEKANKLIEEY